MDTIYCEKCGKELKEGMKAIAITSGSLEESAGGFMPDNEPYTVYCGDCCDLFKAVNDAPRTDSKAGN